MSELPLLLCKKIVLRTLDALENFNASANPEKMQEAIRLLNAYRSALKKSDGVVKAQSALQAWADAEGA